MGGGQRDSYSQAAKWLHWISAAVIVWATASGLAASAIADGPLRSSLSSLNISVTVLFIPVFAARILHRLIAIQPAPANLSPGTLRAARAGHATLYLMTGIVLLSGVLMMEHDIQVFDWFSIPRPLDNERLARLSGLVHRCSSIVLGILILGHVAAVIRHERQGTPLLRRMWFGFPATSTAARTPSAQKNPHRKSTFPFRFREIFALRARSGSAGTR